MQKLRSFISMLFLALLLFPLAEKVQHELGHLHDQHCDSKGLHYCAAEHTCDICDYIFSAAGSAPADIGEIQAIITSTDLQLFAFSSSPVFQYGYTFSLRGPPSC